jgi:dynein heavy chain
MKWVGWLQVGYDEKPRAKWIFDQSAQNTVMVTRVFYTQEMNEAFDQLEEGNDNALKDFVVKQVYIGSMQGV